MDLGLTSILAMNVMLAKLVGISYMYFYANSLTIDDEYVYILAGIVQNGPPSGDLYKYYSLLKYSKTDLSPIALKTYGVLYRLVGIESSCGHRIYVNKSNGLISFTGFLANSSENYASHDILIATADRESLSMNWMLSWRGELDTLERGTGIINPDIIAVIGYSGSHKGKFFSENVVVGEDIEYILISDIDYVLSTPAFTITSPSISSYTFNKVGGGYDIILLTLYNTGVPAPIPEPWSMVTLVVVFIVLASIIAITRKYR